MTVSYFLQLGPVCIGLKQSGLKQMFYSCARILKILLKGFFHVSRAEPTIVVRLQLKFSCLQFIVRLPVLVS